MAESRTDRVTVEQGDLGEVNADVLVIPATTGGSFGARWRTIVQRVGLPTVVPGDIRHGSIHVVAVPGRGNVRLLAFAATVDPGQPTSRDVILSVGRELGQLVDQLTASAVVVATPLLGTGVGRLDPRASLEGLVEGWLETAREGAQLRVVEADKERYEFALSNLADIQAGLAPIESGSRPQPEAKTASTKTASTKTASTGTPAGPTTGLPGWDDLAPDAREVVSLADAFRRASRSGSLHMEQLVVALHDAGDADVRAALGTTDRGELVALAAEQGNVIPPDVSGPRRTRAMPKVSDHVSDALVAARQHAGSEVVTAAHLAQGAMSITRCSFITALQALPARTQARTEVEAGPVARGALMAEPSADTVPDTDATSSDRLNLGREVEMLASVMLARDTPLPLAIGLFGDWGSGKSFFMRMLHERLETISRLAAEERPEAAPFSQHIRQIHFNAWHYVDGNLWASLAANIFDGLVEEAGDELKQEQQDQLGAATERALDARESRVAAERALRAEQERAGRFTTIARSAIPAAVQALRETPGLEEHLKAHQADQQGMSDSAKQFVAAVDAAASFGQESALFRELFRTELTRTRRRATLVWAGVVCAVVTGILVLGELAPWAELLAGIPILLSALTPALLGATRLLRGAQESRWLREKPVVDARNRLADAEMKERLATEEVTAREEELARLRDRGARLHDLVRAARTEYGARLSMMSQLRKDFEQLTWLLWREADGQASAARGSEPPEALRQAVAKVCAEGPGRPSDTLEVDRIVLYIDDLDRCSAKDVVKVLQAVNLLLTFKLFVVVIGVDGRWLESSLSSHYDKLLRSPVEYLEKIIQLPFVLRPMSPEAYAAMVVDLTSARKRMPPRGSDDPKTAEGATSGTPEDTGDSTGMVPPPPASADEEPSQTPAATPTQTPIDVRGTPRMPRPEALVISDAERRLLGKVGSLITTPRTTKRLVNTYRMLRVCAGDDDAARFSPEGGGEYQAVVVLLAILLGCPGQAKEIFDRIMAGDPGADVWMLMREPEKAATDGAFVEWPATAVRSATTVNARFDILEELVDLSDAETYQRWIPLVSRFTYHLPSVVAPTARSV